MRKIVSLVMRVPDALSRCPKLSKYAIFPLRATTTTAPGSLSCSISVLNTVPRRPSRAEERPTCSGGAVGSCAQTTAAEKTRATVRTRLANRLMARLLARGEAEATAGYYAPVRPSVNSFRRRSVPAAASGSALAHPGGGAPRSAASLAFLLHGGHGRRVLSAALEPDAQQEHHESASRRSAHRRLPSGNQRREGKGPGRSVFAVEWPRHGLRDLCSCPSSDRIGHVGGERTGHAFPCHSKPRETRHGDESTQLSHRGGGDGGLGRERATRNGGG